MSKKVRKPKKVRREERRQDTRQYVERKLKEEPGAFWTYLIMRGIVLIILVLRLIDGDYEGAFVCLLTLALYLLPQFFERRLNIDIPSALEIILFIFVFSAEILGEMNSYYLKYSHWDTMMHTTSGFLFAAVGFSLVDLLNRSETIKFELSPAFLAVTAFCFSMTIGVLWEFFEFGADLLLRTDMQKDTILHTIATVELDPTLSNKAVIIGDITEMSLNGEPLGLGGYLDIGLYDTMEDLFVNFIGAVVFSIIGFFEAKDGTRRLTRALGLKRRKKG